MFSSDLLFCNCWGNEMSKLIILNGENTGKEFSLEKGKFKIGRAQDSNLLLSNPTVSRKHATIKYKNGKYFIIDSSRNGTKINGKLVKSKYLEDGDEIEIGSTIIKYERIVTEVEQEKERTKRVMLAPALIGIVFLMVFFLYLSKTGIKRLFLPREETVLVQEPDDSESHFKFARRLYREKGIREENLFLAIQEWKKGLSLQKLEQSETATAELKVAIEELDKRIKDEMFMAYQSYYLGNFQGSKIHLKKILKLIPSLDDKRYQSALAKLKYLERR